MEDRLGEQRIGAGRDAGHPDQSEADVSGDHVIALRTNGTESGVRSMWPVTASVVNGSSSVGELLAEPSARFTDRCRLPVSSHGCV